MKRKFLALLLAFVMVVGMLPVSAFAESPTIEAVTVNRVSGQADDEADNAVTGAFKYAVTDSEDFSTSYGGGIYASYLRVGFTKIESVNGSYYILCKDGNELADADEAKTLIDAATAAGTGPYVSGRKEVVSAAYFEDGGDAVLWLNANNVNRDAMKYVAYQAIPKENPDEGYDLYKHTLDFSAVTLPSCDAFAPATGTELGMTLSTLTEDLAVNFESYDGTAYNRVLTEDSDRGMTLKLTGKVNFVNWPEFSNDTDLQSGHYVAINVKNPTHNEQITKVVLNGSMEREFTYDQLFGENNDEDGILLVRVDDIMEGTDKSFTLTYKGNYPSKTDDNGEFALATFKFDCSELELLADPSKPTMKGIGFDADAAKAKEGLEALGGSPGDDFDPNTMYVRYTGLTKGKMYKVEFKKDTASIYEEQYTVGDPGSMSIYFTFESNGGSHSKEPISSGEYSVTLYRLKDNGTATEATDWEEVSDVIEGNQTVTLSKVTFDLDNGMGTVPDETYYEVGSEVTMPEAPEKEQFTFGGWQVNDATTTLEAGATYITTEDDATITATWTQNITEHTVTFNLNGGNVSDSTDNVTVQVEEGQIVDEADIPTPTKDGYEFDGWATRSGTEGSYTYTKVDLTTYEVREDVILYAQWNAVQPTIEVVPANLTTVDGQKPPMYGQAKEYTAELDADTKTITVTATGLQKTENSEGTKAYWVGIGLTNQENATYATGWGDYDANGAKFTAADNSQVVDGKTYDTMYWGAGSAEKNDFWTLDGSKTGYVAVKVGDAAPIVYTIKFNVDVATYKLTTSHTGEGTVTTDAEDANAPLYEGGVVTITATPGEGQKVATMTVNGKAVTGTTNAETGVVTYEVTIGKADVAVAVSFVDANAQERNVTVADPMPEGIESITTVPSGKAFSGEPVTVTVTAKTGYEVTAVTYSYEVDSVKKTETVTGGSFIMPDADVTVTATAKATISAGFAWTAAQANEDRNTAAAKFGKDQGLNDGLDQTVWFMINTDIQGNHYWYEISDGADVLWEGAMDYAADAIARGMISASFLHTNPNGDAHNKDGKTVPETLVVKVWKTNEAVTARPNGDPFDSKTITTGDNPLKIDTVTTAIEDNTVTVKFNQHLFGRYVVELKKGSEVVSAETLECEAPTPAVDKNTGYTFNDVTFEDGDYTVSVYQAACTIPTDDDPNPVTGSAFASKSFTIGTVTVGNQSGKFNTAASTKVKEVITVTDPVAEAGQAFVGWVINDTDTPISTEDLNNTVLTGTVTYKAKFKEVTSTDILVTPFSGDTTLGKNGSDLQSGVKVEESADGKTFSFTGDSKYIFDWTEFSSVPAEQEGNFLAIKILPALANSGTTIKVGNTTLDETGIYVVILNGSNGYKNTVTVTAGDKTAEYTLDFTNVDRLPGTITAVAKKTGDEAINVAFQNGTIVLSGVVANDEALKGLMLNVTCNDVVKEIAVTLTKDAENNTITATADPAVLAGNTFTFDTSMLAVKNENAAEHATVAPPQAAVSEDIPADKKDAAEAISNALAVTDDDGNTVTKVDESVLQKYADVEANNAEAKDTLLSGADAIVKDTANADKVPDALKTAIADAADENATDAQKNAVTTVVQVYTKIEVTGVETAAGGSVTGFTVSITPMAQTVVTTVSKTELENGTDTITTFDPAKDAAANAGANAIVVDEKPIPVSEPTVVTLALPEGAFTDSTVYILHEKDTGHRYVYDGTVVKNVLTFTSTHGFSNFTITSADPTVAKTGGVNYASLKEAVDEVANNGTITLMTDCAENVTVSKEIVFALELNGHLFTGKFEASTGYTMAKDEESNTYTFTKVVVDNTVAMIGEDKYDSLTAAVEAVTNNGTIKLMKDCDETVTVSKEIVFTLDLNDNQFTGKFEAGTGYTMAKDEVSNTYTFTKVVVDDTVAKIGDTPYKSLDAAVKAVTNNGTIKLMKDCDETVTVSKEIVFTLELDGHKFTGKFEAGTGYTMAKDEESNTYTFTKVVVDDTVAKIGDTTYKSLADAVANVKNDETITLVADVTLTEDITVNRVVKFTVDLNGHTITGGAIVAYDGYKNDSTTENEYNFVSTGGENPPSTGGGSGGGSASYAISVPANVANGKISVNPDRASEGTKVTITVTPDEGYKVGTVTVTDKNGNKINVTDAGGNKYTFTMPKSKVDVNVTFVSEDAKFLDVPADSYYAAAVDWAVAKGITQGTSETMFSPNKACTRAEVVTFLWRAAGSPKSTGANPFTDVAEGAYYYDAVLWAVEKGITVGTTETTFSPDTVCSRSEIVTFLWRYEETPEAEASSFDDVKADDWFYNAVNWAVSEEITVGTGANAFSPAVNCTRAEVVTFLFRDMA